MTRMLVSVALASTALLAACGGRAGLPGPTVVQAVPEPVAVSCLQPGQRPTPPRRLSQDQPVPPASLTEMVGRFRAKLVEWAAYGQTADALLKLCEQVPAGPPAQRLTPPTQEK